MGRIPDEDVQRVRDATDVVSLIGESVMLKHKGRLYWGLCPFHGEKTPSFKVDPATQLWHCFGCGVGGDVFGFIMQAEHLEFIEAVRLLADRARIEIREEGGGAIAGEKERLAAVCDATATFFHRVLIGSKESSAAKARDYLHGRGFGIDVAKEFGIGYAPGHGSLVRHLSSEGFTDKEMVDANVAVKTGRGVQDRFYERVMFPIRDLRGRCIGFGGRVLGTGEPKYLNTQETPLFHKSRNLYAIEKAKNEIVKAKQAVVVEGYTDAIAMHRAGFPNTVATLGTALTRDHVRLLGRFTSSIVCLFDGDEAGLKAAERAMEYIDVSVRPEAGRDPIELKVAIVPAGADPADFVAARGADSMRELLASSVPLVEFVLERKMGGYDLTSAESRSRALSTLATILAPLGGTLLGQHYANFVADRLRTDFATVSAEVNRAAARSRSTGARDGTSAEQSAKAPAEVILAAPERLAELAYVALVARHPEVRPMARTVLAEGLMRDPALTALVEAIIQAGDKKDEELTAHVAGRSNELVQALSSVLATDAAEGESSVSERLIAGRLKEFGIERQIKDDKASLSALDPVKDKTAYDDMFRKVAALQLQLDRVRRGKESPITDENESRSD